MLLPRILLKEVRECIQGTVQMLTFHCILAFAFGRYLMVSLLPLANALAANFNGCNFNCFSLHALTALVGLNNNALVSHSTKIS